MSDIIIEKAYNTVEQYNFKKSYNKETDEGDYTRETALVKVVVDNENDKVYLQTDPFKYENGGQLRIRRLAEFSTYDVIQKLLVK